MVRAGWCLFALVFAVWMNAAPLLLAQDAEPAAAARAEEGAAAHGEADAAAHHVDLGSKIGLWSVIPFVALLLCIAVLPLACGHWWEHNRNKAIVAAVLAVPVVIYLVSAFGQDGLTLLRHTGQEYISFILLLASLYVISGGIFVKGSLDGTPIFNTAILAFGAIIASIVGTTGASVLLIRPLLRANAARENKAHIFVFFIFIVSNCGGLLTALGDPPLFLGYLAGVPFTWTFRLWSEWAIVNGSLLVIFHLWDQIVFNKEEIIRPGSQLEEVQKHEPLGFLGLHNLLFLAGIVAVIYCSGAGIGNGGERWPYGIAEGLMLVLAITAYFSTSSANRASNNFTFAPILEVAILFLGIFATMIPALALLNTHGRELGLSEPWHFFWATGILSSFLDNAPTYLTFAATACGIYGIPLEGAYLARLIENPDPVTNRILEAISTGAVFMGANTYIGNGPNFMVKAIAEESGVKMPSFFGYMVYSGLILIPLFIVLTFVKFM